jgi:hypothetical protein
MRLVNNCGHLHQWARHKKRYRFPFDAKDIPSDGIYLLFEKGEEGHGGERVVRVGTHTGVGQLYHRLLQHFVVENKDRSIFRKNIGRALLSKKKDPYLSVWELDMTPAAARQKYKKLVKATHQQGVERAVSAYMRRAFSFVFVPMPKKEKRLALESKIISTLSHCSECGPGAKWLGGYSPKEKIRTSGLWLVNELYKEPLKTADLVYLKGL